MADPVFRGVLYDPKNYISHRVMDLLEPSGVSLNSAKGLTSLPGVISDLDLGSLENDSHASV